MFATADPLTQANAAMTELMALTASVAPRRRGTLLIVDDEEGPRLSLRVIFKDAYDLLMAEDGQTAIELAQKNPIDVAVLDIRMAGMSGIEVLERLRFVQPLKPPTPSGRPCACGPPIISTNLSILPPSATR
jgi:CheY-like chemotaxis protein